VWFKNIFIKTTHLVKKKNQAAEKHVKKNFRKQQKNMLKRISDNCY